MKYLTSQNAIEAVKEYISESNSKKPLVIAIDGRSASGKTTFAYRLQKEINSPVIHTDDFFRPRNNGNIEISEFSGNFDLLRFKTEVIDGVLNNEKFEYGVFDCKLGKITHTVSHETNGIYIIEGAYSLHPNLSEYADLKLFFNVNSDIQKSRIVKRNGKDGYERFRDLWIPAEERYIKYYSVESRCDIMVDTSTEVHNG